MKAFKRIPHWWMVFGIATLSSGVLAGDPGCWTVLFDGSTSPQFRGYRRDTFPDKGWKVVDGTLKTVPGGDVVDLVTLDSYSDFELEFEWKVSPGGNSGVIYRVSEEHDQPWYSGPEYQVLDDERHGDGRNPKTSAGSLYALVSPCLHKTLKPVGEFNQSRILVQNGQVEHWLNDHKVLAYQWGSAGVKHLIQGSKFKDQADFMALRSGKIVFQHHGEEAWYRNIRVRALDASASQKPYESLFDGKTSAGWRGFRKDAFPTQGWVIEDGVLTHKNKAGGGDIITEKEYENFDLQFEWKVTPGANSGVKYFILEERGGAIGHEYQVIDDGRHADALRGPKYQTAAFYDVLIAHNRVLNPVGEWNQSRVVTLGSEVEHWLNGIRALDYALGSEETLGAVGQSKFKNVERFGVNAKGHILLQDHQDEVSYRNIEIRSSR